MIGVGFCDLAVLGLQAFVNSRRRVYGLAAIGEFGPVSVILFYLSLLVIFAVLFRSALSHAPRLRRAAAIIGILLVLRGVGVACAFQSPRDRDRLAGSEAALVSAASRVQDYAARHGHPPRTLSELDPRNMLRDGWNVPLKYEVVADGCEFKLSAVGVPEACKAQNALSRLTLTQRVPCSSTHP